MNKIYFKEMETHKLTFFKEIFLWNVSPRTIDQQRWWKESKTVQVEIR